MKPHTPVLLQEVIDNLSVKDNGLYLDATFGAGGHSAAILEQASCKVFSIDRDNTVPVEAVASRYPKRLHHFHSSFSKMHEVVGHKQFDGILFDLGMSSMQVDTPERGFSFTSDGPLLMTMGLNKLTAMDIINKFNCERLAEIILEFGEERRAHKIAKTIVEHRKKFGNITSTKELVKIVLEAFGIKISKSKPTWHHKGIHPATKTFQAFRIAVNDELAELETAMQSAVQMLKPDGRLLVISFHSLEDTVVKRIFREVADGKHFCELNNRKVIKPTYQEIKLNNRARSARMRVLQRLL